MPCITSESNSRLPYDKKHRNLAHTTIQIAPIRVGCRDCGLAEVRAAST